jgi:hypothetical protein
MVHVNLLKNDVDMSLGCKRPGLAMCRRRKIEAVGAR